MVTKNRRVVIVGVGALGSHVVQSLRNVDAEIQVIDFDRVEQKNVASQFHARQSVGKLKAEGLKQLMSFCFQRHIVAIPQRLRSDNARVLLEGAALVVDCVDNTATRWLIRESAAMLKVPCLHGALAGSGDFARVGWAPEFTLDPDGDAGAPTCENGEALPFIALAAAHVAQAAALFLKSGRQRSLMISSFGVQILS